MFWWLAELEIWQDLGIHRPGIRPSSVSRPSFRPVKGHALEKEKVHKMW